MVIINKEGDTITYVTHPGDLQPCFIEWSKDTTSSYLGGYMGGFTTTIPSGINNRISVDDVTTKLKSLDTLTFTLMYSFCFVVD